MSGRDALGMLAINSSSLFFVFLGLGLAAIGIAIGVWARNHPKADADVRYGVNQVRIAPRGEWSKRPEDIGVTYRGQPVDFVEQLEIAFRNYGPSRLNVDDAESPITVTLIGEVGVILDVESTCATKTGDRTVTFDLLPMKVGDVRIAKVLHTVPEPETGDSLVILKGDLKRVPFGIRRGGPRPSARLGSVSARGFIPIALLILLAVAIAAVVESYGDAHRYAYDSRDTADWSDMAKFAWAWLIVPGVLFAIVLGGWLVVKVGKAFNRMLKRLDRRSSPFGEYLD